MTSWKSTLLTEALKKHIDRSGKWLRKLLRKMLKYVYKVPCYLQEAMWKLKGLPLTRQQMSKWLIDVFNNQLSSLYDLLLKELKRQRFLNMDETPIILWLQKKTNTYYWLSPAENLKKKILPNLLTVTEDHPRRPRNC